MGLPRAWFTLPLGLLVAAAGCGLFSIPAGNGSCGNFPLISCPSNELEAAGPDCNFCCIQAAATCATSDAGDPCCSGTCGDGGLCSCGEVEAPCHGASDCCSGVCIEDSCSAVDAGVDAGTDAG